MKFFYTITEKVQDSYYEMPIICTCHGTIEADTLETAYETARKVVMQTVSKQRPIKGIVSTNVEHFFCAPNCPG